MTLYNANAIDSLATAQLNQYNDEEIRIVVLKGQSKNNVLRVFADQIVEGLRRINKETTLIDLTDPISLKEFAELVQAGAVDGVLSFNAMMGDLFPENLKIPFVGWMVDSPHYHLTRLRHVGGRRHYIFPADHHVDFLIQGQISAGSSVLLAGAKEARDNSKEFSERKIKVLMAASWMGEPQKFWLQFPQGHPYQKLVRTAIEILDEDQVVDTLSAFNKSARLLNLEFSIDNTFAAVASMTQSFIRQVDRIKFVKTLAGSGIPFTVVGDGWGSHIKVGTNVNYLNSIDSSKISQLYADAKVVVNINASNGACERLFDAMSVRACVLTDYSNTLFKIFESGRELLFYDRKEPSSAIGVLEYALDIDNWNLMTRRAQVVVAENHLWSHRAEVIMKIFHSLRTCT